MLLAARAHTVLFPGGFGQEGSVISAGGPYSTHAFTFDHVYDVSASQKKVGVGDFPLSLSHCIRMIYLCSGIFVCDQQVL